MKIRLRQALLLVGVVFILVLINKCWDELSLRISSTYLPVFILSVVIATAGNFFTCFFFQDLLGKYSTHVGNHQCLKLFFFSQVAKYVPGKVWSIIYQRMILDRPGSTSSIVFANLDLAVIQIVNCGLIALSILVWSLTPWFSLVLLGVAFLLSIFFVKTCHLFDLIILI